MYVRQTRFGDPNALGKEGARRINNSFEASQDSERSVKLINQELIEHS